MKRLPEGIRRVCAVVGVALVAAWLAVIGSVSDGFDEVRPMGWVTVHP